MGFRSRMNSEAKICEGSMGRARLPPSQPLRWSIGLRNPLHDFTRIQSLDDKIETKTKLYSKTLSEGEARKLFQQLIDAVDYCHNKGVYRRELKPENLLLTSNGDLKISDFGLSALSKPGDLLSTKCGSPSYVALELLVIRAMMEQLQMFRLVE